MARTTRRDVEKAVGLLASVIDMGAMARRYGAGHLALDYYNPGDNPRAYKVVWILDENGAQYEPFGTFRRRGDEMVDTIHFLTNAHYAGVLKRGEE